MMKLVSTSRRYIRRSACCWCQAWHIVFQSYRCSIICDVPFGVVCLVHLRLFDCMPMVLCSSQFDFESPFVSYHGTRLFAFELCFRSCRYRAMMSWCISARFMYRVRWPLYDLCVCLLQVAGGDVMSTRVCSLLRIRIFSSNCPSQVEIVIGYNVRCFQK